MESLQTARTQALLLWLSFIKIQKRGYEAFLYIKKKFQKMKIHREEVNKFLVSQHYPDMLLKQSATVCEAETLTTVV